MREEAISTLRRNLPRDLRRAGLLFIIASCGVMYGFRKEIYGYPKISFSYPVDCKCGIEIKSDLGDRSFDALWPGSDRLETIKLCPDPKSRLPLKVGMVLTKFEYYDHTVCMAIDETCKVDYLRDSARNVVNIKGERFLKDN
jgi:hypothetical protein